MFHHFGIEPRRDAELRTRGNRAVDLLAGENGPRPYKHIGICLRHASYDLVGALCAEGDFGAVYPAVAQSLCKLFRVVYFIELDYRYDAHVAELVHKLAHFFC